MRPAVEIVEVSPRDGLQNETSPISTAQKLELIRRAAQAGLRRIEVTSFVHPTRVPQMADAEALVQGLPDVPVGWSALVVNRRGFDRAVTAGIPEVNVVAVCTDTFAQRNQGTDADGTVAVVQELAEAGAARGVKLTATLAVAFGCPFEGEVPPERVGEMARRLSGAGVAEIVLADTIGVAVPTDVTERVGQVREAAGEGVALRAHFHNTRNTGLANAAAAVACGVTSLDASIGGIGGCPFAPNATGNIPTEDLAYLLRRMGHPTGVDLEGLSRLARWVESDRLGRPVPGLLSKAGIFPDIARLQPGDGR